MKMPSRVYVGLWIAIAGAAAAAACDTVQLLAPTGSTVTLTSASTVVPTGGTTQVTAFVYESSGTPVQNGTTVRFTTNLGRVDPVETQTRNGYAAATFSAGEVSGTADVSAWSGAAGGAAGSSEGASSTNVVRITVGAAAADAVVLNANPGTVPAGTGGTVTIIASAMDANGNRLRNVPVTFSADAGTLSATLAVTDANGDATVQLTTSTQTIVTARVGSKTATFTVTVSAGVQIVVTAPTGASGTTSETFVFTVTPAQQVAAQDILVDFGDGETVSLGGITGPTPVGHRYATPGNRAVRAIQTNINGSTSTATVTVRVTP